MLDGPYGYSAIVRISMHGMHLDVKITGIAAPAASIALNCSWLRTGVAPKPLRLRAVRPRRFMGGDEICGAKEDGVMGVWH